MFTQYRALKFANKHLYGFFHILLNTLLLAGCLLLIRQPNSYEFEAFIRQIITVLQSEYISSSDARLEFISGFTGSAGTAIVTEDQGALWTDGRYYKQAENELIAHAAEHGHQQWTLMKEGGICCSDPCCALMIKLYSTNFRMILIINLVYLYQLYI